MSDTSDEQKKAAPDPAKGSRRALIFETIRSHGGINPGPGGPNAAAKRLADAVETALHNSALGDPGLLGAMPKGDDAPTSGEAIRKMHSDDSAFPVPEEQIPAFLAALRDFAWMGEEPTEGTRRALVRNTVRLLSQRTNGQTTPLMIADAIEAALIGSEDDLRGQRAQKTIDRLEGICEERWKRIGELEELGDELRARVRRFEGLGVQIGNELDRVSISRGQSITQRVRVLCERYAAHFDRIGASRDPDEAGAPASRAMVMLDEEGVPRVDGPRILTIDQRLAAFMDREDKIAALPRETLEEAEEAEAADATLVQIDPSMIHAGIGPDGNPWASLVGLSGLLLSLAEAVEAGQPTEHEIAEDASPHWKGEVADSDDGAADYSRPFAGIEAATDDSLPPHCVRIDNRVFRINPESETVTEMFMLTIVVSGSATEITIASDCAVGELIEEALHRRQLPFTGIAGWTLRTRQGTALNAANPLSEAGIRPDATLFLDPDAGGGA